MANKRITQKGMHKVLWKLLKKAGGTFTISDREITEARPNDAVRIVYDPSIKSFTLSLHKLKESDQLSDIIVTPGNLN